MYVLSNRFHPSHRLFSRLKNHSTVSLTIPLGDYVFLLLISSNLVSGCRPRFCLFVCLFVVFVVVVVVVVVFCCCCFLGGEAIPE